MRIRWTPEARDDLERIRDYIRRDRPLVADRMAARLMAATERLALFPRIGRPGLEPGTRELGTVRPYVIVYRIAADDVEILRVWHAAQRRA